MFLIRSHFGSRASGLWSVVPVWLDKVLEVASVIVERAAERMKSGGRLERQSSTLRYVGPDESEDTSSQPGPTNQGGEVTMRRQVRVWAVGLSVWAVLCATPLALAAPTTSRDLWS